MRRNCNLELRLLPSSTSLPSTGSSHHRHPMVESLSGSPQQQQQQQQQPLTIFYNGRVCVSDVTELQARSIILLASREMEERMKSSSGSSTPVMPVSPSLPSQLYSPTGISMKRSLQQFLQKRKHRIQATSPYH